MYLHSTETTVSLSAIPNGAAGVRVTLAAMAKFARNGARAPVVRETALNVIAALNQKDYRGEMTSLHRFVRDSIRYVRDVHNVETVQTPEKTLEYSAGDCDDKSTLLASLLLSVGHPARFVAVGKQWGQYSHVYVESLLGTRWVPLESTEPVEAGWKPPNMVSRMTFPIK